jgi:YidC/Oxa1 family membrane protein insertase
MFHTVIYVPIYNALLWLVKVIPGHDLGLAIIIVTIIIRLVLYYPSLAAIKSSRQLQSLQPRLKALQEQYKNDKEGLAREQMKLYKESKVNPAASCLPLIIQLVVFYQLYQVFLNGIKVDGNNFLNPEHLKDLASSLQTYFRANAMNTNFFGLLDLTAVKSVGNIIIAVFTGLTQFWQTKMLAAPSEPKISGARDEAMTATMNRTMTYTLPLVMAWITYTLPAGLGLYWSASSVFGIIQQYIFLRSHPLAATNTPPKLNAPPA